MPKVKGLEVRGAYDATLERYRRDWWEGRKRIKNVEVMLLEEEENIETQGVLMGKDHFAGLVVHPERWFLDFAENYKQWKWLDYNISRNILESIDKDRKVLEITPLTPEKGEDYRPYYSPSKMLKTIDTLDLWDDEGSCPTLKVLADEELPLILRGTGGECMLLANVYAMEGRATTLKHYQDQRLRQVHDRITALNDPELEWVEPYDEYGGKPRKIHVSSIKKLEYIKRYHTQCYIHFNDDTELRVSEEQLLGIHERHPEIPFDDKIYTFKVSEQLKNDFRVAWQREDPFMIHNEDFEKAYLKLCEFIEDNGKLPCSLHFWAKHWNDEPPSTMSKYRSLYTVDEWGRAFIELALMGKITYAKIDPRTDDNDEYTGMSISLRVDHVPKEHLDGLDLTVKQAKYKAKHLQCYLSDVIHYREQAGNSPYGWWELEEDLAVFESHFVRP